MMIKREELQAFVSEISERREEIVENLLKFFVTDMMFFWGEEKGLIEKQEEVWGPLLKWATEVFETKFVKARDFDVPEQDMQSGFKIKFFMEDLTDKELAVLYYTTYTTKSVLLGAAFVRKKIDVEQVFEAASLEETWQQQAWGIDDAIEKNHKELESDLKVLAEFLG